MNPMPGITGITAAAPPALLCASWMLIISFCIFGVEVFLILASWPSVLTTAADFGLSSSPRSATH